MVTVSVLVDRMKINGSLARVAIKHLEREGLIRRIVHHNGQLIYSAFCCRPLQLVRIQADTLASISPLNCIDRLRDCLLQGSLPFSRRSSLAAVP